MEGNVAINRMGDTMEGFERLVLRNPVEIHPLEEWPPMDYCAQLMDAQFYVVEGGTLAAVGQARGVLPGDYRVPTGVIGQQDSGDPT